MKLPITLQVGPITYRIEQSSEKIQKARSSSLNPYAAYAQHMSPEIVIDTNIDGDMLVNCLVHEAVHAMLQVYSLHDVKTDEQFVEQFSTILMDTLRRNPAFTAILMGLEL